SWCSDRRGILTTLKGLKVFRFGPAFQPTGFQPTGGTPALLFEESSRQVVGPATRVESSWTSERGHYLGFSRRRASNISSALLAACDSGAKRNAVENCTRASSRRPSLSSALPKLIRISGSSARNGMARA